MEQKWINKMLDEKYQAGLFSRLVALFYDLMTLAITLLIVGTLTTRWMYGQTNAPELNDMVMIREYILEHEFHLFVINWVVLATVAILIQYVFPMFSKQTVGMKMVGLYLRDENAIEISKVQYVKRELMKLYLFPTLFLSLKKGKRPLYDEKSKSYLLK
ncbi:RDD family protein [Anaerobacillus isosaccharinicus]|uniref:RDD family protein n=1 Tax=Anaerobacillus isosaccharinicus TaxID=1532552 RepID=A0A1S2MDY4_9BACI|nr:RDD family protein [Anaerobacillus isosaccharinicus]MBA5584947.1 RDD family protein [Anaerobacillus isosaccharinicus]QOY36697.1 RDD family protein [Anaerobacillus isosaccharinicus]